MIKQVKFELSARERGFHLITGEVLENLKGKLPVRGLLHLFICHTSAGICINENADPTVREDFERYFNKIVPEGIPGLQHTLEGPDDMPAHVKSVLTGHELSIPIANRELALGTWQGIYLCEFRNRPRSRTIQATIIS